MKKNLIICLLSMTLPSLALGKGIDVPIQLDYLLLKNVLVNELYRGEGQSANLWQDKQKCSYLRLTHPRIDGQDGQVRILNNVSSQLGAAIAGQCVPLVHWQGTFETLQKPTLSKNRLVLSLPVTQATAYDTQGQPLNIDKLNQLLTQQAQPWLANLKIDLTQSRGDIEKTLAPYVPDERVNVLKSALDSLIFTKAEASNLGMVLGVHFDAPKASMPLKPEAPFSEAEQVLWHALWNKWALSMRKAIGQMPSNQQPAGLETALLAVLADAGNAFELGLKLNNPDQPDAVRSFFTRSWQKLSPFLSALANQLPMVDGMQYLSFLAATDVLYTLETRAEPFGLTLSSDGLRRLARHFIAKESQSARRKI